MLRHLFFHLRIHSLLELKCLSRDVIYANIYQCNFIYFPGNQKLDVSSNNMRESIHIYLKANSQDVYAF